MRSFDALVLDPSMTPYYIKALLTDYHLFFVEGKVEEAYTEVKNVKERLAFIDIIDKEFLSYKDEEDDDS